MKQLHIIMVAVSSVNGKITNGEESDIRNWVSKEDAKYFSELISQHNVIVMGRRTFEAIRHYLRPQPDKLRLVLTSHPAQFQKQAIKNSLEFTNESPEQLTQRLVKQGFSKMLLLGGGITNAAFLNAGLVDELYLTIEPIIFGTGIDLFGGVALKASLSLVDFRELNTQGTVLLRYRLRRLKKHSAL